MVYDIELNFPHKTTSLGRDFLHHGMPPCENIPPPANAPRRRTIPVTSLDPSELVGLSREERRRRRRATLK